MATLIPAERDYDKDEDRIGELPDDILTSFISPMGMKEAAKTSVLSKRWRYLWAQWTHLDFNHLIVLPDSDPDVYMLYFLSPDEKKKYINWVNQVVDLHCGPCIDTFRVGSSFGSSDTHHIDKWVRFALLKKVKNLELDLGSLGAVYVYALSFDVLKPSLGVGHSSSNFLQSLVLKGINVTGDILEYLLAQCHLLERLHVEGSDTLVRWRVFDSSCKLKQLTILRTPKLEELEIDAVNLLYLHYRSSNICTNVVFKNMPILVEAVFDGSCLPESTQLFRQLSRLTAQISKLTLDFNRLAIPIPVLPTFCKLEQFTLKVQDEIEFDIVVITQFLKAFPTLHEFTLEITWPDDELWKEAVQLGQVDQLEAANKYTWEYLDLLWDMELERINHSNLKEFKVIGFSGCNTDVELILFIIRCACNLETLICDSTRRDNTPVMEVIEASRSRAGKLVKLVHPKISVVIV